MRNKILLILVLISFLGFGQKIDSIEWDSYTQTISFYKDKKIIKEYHLKENNYYKGLQFPIKKESGNRIIYDISNIGTENIIKRFLNELDIEPIVKDELKFREISTTSHFSYSGHLAVVTYNIILNTISPDISFKKGIVFVFNKRGELIFSLPERIGGYSSFAITNNLKYVSFKSTNLEKTWELGDINNNTALYIYSLNNNNLIYKVEDLLIQGPISKTGIIYYTKWLKDRKKESIILFNNKLYRFIVDHNIFKVLGYFDEYIMLQNKQTKELKKVYYKTMYNVE